MRKFFPRLLYIAAVFSWVILLWPNPMTIFLAACFSCLTLPVYRYLRKKAIAWRSSALVKTPASRWMRILAALARAMPVFAYSLFVCACLIIPVAALALLVSPQALAGYNKLRELQASNFKLPPSWTEHIDHIKEVIHEYPRVEKIIKDAFANLDSLFDDAIGILVSQGFGVVGSTMNALWIIFLFLTLTVLFSVYAPVIRKVTSRILQLPSSILSRFITSVHKALKAITLGICLVALIQGFMCGVAFAVVGISQPAFWGLLATIVAPIPMIGTALVWAPLAISLWFSGNTVGAVGLAIWGGVFVASADNFIRPFFLKQGIEASFFVLILSILCGMTMFGAMGLVVGPILLAVGMCAYDVANAYYEKRY
ncbi:MAG: AI-2E family transporter [Desulfovibrio sp.]|nr:AI-2E family transporter [Desulfovibrio sp.]